MKNTHSASTTVTIVMHVANDQSLFVQHKRNSISKRRKKGLVCKGQGSLESNAWMYDVHKCNLSAMKMGSYIFNILHFMRSCDLTAAQWSQYIRRVRAAVFYATQRNLLKSLKNKGDFNMLLFLQPQSDIHCMENVCGHPTIRPICACS